jgi:hypothetical protein
LLCCVPLTIQALEHSSVFFVPDLVTLLHFTPFWSINNPERGSILSCGTFFSISVVASDWRSMRRDLFLYFYYLYAKCLVSRALPLSTILPLYYVYMFREHMNTSVIRITCMVRNIPSAWSLMCVSMSYNFPFIHPHITSV